MGVYSECPLLAGTPRRGQFFILTKINSMNTIRHYSQRRGFTLVELLVVIAVISTLMGLLLVGVNGAREAARRIQCTNNQKEIATAILADATSANGTLPGLVSTRSGKELSWALSILPGLQEANWYEKFRKETLTPTELKDFHVKTLVCPSDFDKARKPLGLSYVVNCGEYDEKDGDMDCGLFVDRRPPSSKRVKLDDIKAGASNIILLTENKDATAWLRLDNSNSVLPWPLESEQPGGAIGDIGFHWGFGAPRINQQGTSIPGAFANARPSSGHPGVVIAAFADGHVDTINDDIDLDVYIKMCDYCADPDEHSL